MLVMPILKTKLQASARALGETIWTGKEILEVKKGCGGWRGNIEEDYRADDGHG